MTRLNKLFRDPIRNGIVRLIAGGDAFLKNKDDTVIGDCIAIVYTFGTPLFPLLRRCVQNNDQRMLFWFFSQMVCAKINVFNVRFDF